MMSRGDDSASVPPAGALERVADGIVVVDEEFRFTYSNRAAQRILGAGEAELLGASLWDVFSGSEGPLPRSRVGTVMKRGESVSCEEYSPELDCRLTVELVPEDTGLTIVFRDVTGSSPMERQLDRILETTPVGVVVLSADGELERANTRAEDLLGLSKSEIEGRTYDQPEWDIWGEEGEPISTAEHPVSRVIATGEPVYGFTHGITLPDGTDRWLSSNVAPVLEEESKVWKVVVALEDVTGLKRLDRLISIAQPINDLLNDVSNREEMEQGVCALLAASPLYDLVWVARYEPSIGTLEPCAHAGVGEQDVADFSIPIGEDTTDRGPVRRTIDSGEVEVLTDGPVEPSLESICGDIVEDGPRQAAAVPIIHEGRLRGVIGLHTDRHGAFDEREQQLIRTLGRRVGQLVDALETRALLHEDTVVELTLRSTDPGSLLVRLSDRLQCQLTVESTIPLDGNTLVYFLTVSGEHPEKVVEAANGESSVSRVRELHETSTPEGGTIELELTEHSLAQRLVANGAVIQSDTIRDGTAEVVCHVPPSTDIRSLVEQVTVEYPETELASKQEVNRSNLATERPIDQVLGEVFTEELTDQQQRVLRAAYHGGFFRSPRASTATEIATALSLTQSTFSYHLRNAQHRLLDRLFDAL